MKKLLVHTALYVLLCYSTANLCDTLDQTSFKTVTTGWANTVIKKYDVAVCPIATQMYQIVLNAPAKAWDYAHQLYAQIATMPLFDYACKNPHDAIYWHELTTQANLYSTIMAQQQEQDADAYQIAGVIIMCYFTHLQTTLRA